MQSNLKFTVVRKTAQASTVVCDRTTYYAICGWLFHQKIEGLFIKDRDSLFQAGALVGFVRLEPQGEDEAETCAFKLDELERLKVPIEVAIATAPK